MIKKLKIAVSIFTLVFVASTSAASELTPITPEREAYFLRHINLSITALEADREKVWSDLLKEFDSNREQATGIIIGKALIAGATSPTPESWRFLSELASTVEQDVVLKVAWESLSTQPLPDQANLMHAIEFEAVKTYSTESMSLLLGLYYLIPSVRATRLYEHGSREKDPVEGNEKNLLFYAALLAEIYASHTGGKNLSAYEHPSFINIVDQMDDAEILRRSVALPLYPSFELKNDDVVKEDGWHVTQFLSESDLSGTSKLSAVMEDPYLERPLETALTRLVIYHRLHAAHIEPFYWGSYAGNARVALIMYLGNVATQTSDDPIGKATITASEFALRHFTSPVRKPQSYVRITGPVNNDSKPFELFKNGDFSQQSIESCLASRPLRREDSEIQLQCARRFLADLLKVPKHWKWVSLQTVLEESFFPQMPKGEPGTKKASLSWTQVPKGVLSVDGSFVLNNNTYIMHKIPLSTATIVLPTEEFAGETLDSLRLDADYRCLSFKVYTEKFAGLCFKEREKRYVHDPLGETVHWFGLEYRAWSPPQSEGVPTFDVEVALQPAAGVRWIAARVPSAKPYLAPNCIGCLSHSYRMPNGYEELSGWYLFAVLPGKRVTITANLEPTFQTDLVEEALNKKIASLAKDQAIGLEIMELGESSQQVLAGFDNYKLSEPSSEFSLLRYAANLPHQVSLDPKKELEDQVMASLSKLRKMVEVALANDIYGSINPTKIQEEVSRRAIFEETSNEAFRPQWGETIPQAPVQERRQVLLAGIGLFAWDIHHTYAAPLERSIRELERERQAFAVVTDPSPDHQLAIAATTKRLVARCLALQALQYESNLGPLPQMISDKDVLEICKEHLGEERSVP